MRTTPGSAFIAGGNTVPGGIPAREFLRRYWQKRPKLIRGAFPGIRSFLGPEDLFRLAGRDNVESRLVLEHGGEYPWQVMHGPFRARDFRALPRAGWTLLVQNVDLHHREGAELLRRFRFVPNWRIDDLMVSYAPPGGSVGAHLDGYDVFLLQALGRRRWSIDTRKYGEDDFIPGLDLRILRDFRQRSIWRLDPGDMLYLPPGVAHHGTAETECITYSIGLRAPSGRDLALHYVEDHAPDAPRYADPDLRRPAHPGEIPRRTLSRLRKLARCALADADAMNRWFGQHITLLPEGIAPTLPRRRLETGAFLALWRRHGALCRAHPSRAAYVTEPDGVVLFVNGKPFMLPVGALGLARAFTRDWRIEFPPPEVAGPRVNAALCRMYNIGLLVPEGP